jgi:hypothetical protein
VSEYRPFRRNVVVDRAFARVNRIVAVIRKGCFFNAPQNVDHNDNNAVILFGFSFVCLG